MLALHADVVVVPLFHCIHCRILSTA